MRNKKLTAFLLLMSISALVSGHEFWLQSKKYKYAIGETAVIDFIAGEEFNGDFWNLTIDRIVKIEHITRSSKSDLKNKIIEGNTGKNLSIPLNKEGTHVIAFESNSSYIEMSPEEFLEYLEEDGLDYIIRQRAEKGTLNSPAREMYSRCAKTLLQVGSKTDDSYLQPADLKLEIMPLQNPYNLKRGDEMFFQVLYEGKPIGDTLVKVWNRKDGQTLLQNIYTENNGIMSTRLSNEGSWMISCVRMVESNDEKVDYQSYWASLVFGF
jgi:uncharacterized GH25 family protein